MDKDSELEQTSVSNVSSALPGFFQMEDRVLEKAQPYLEHALTAALYAPVEEFLSRPSKRFRGRLAQTTYDLISTDRGSKKRATVSEFVELIHAGSLIIDDIQDGSTTRRGMLSLHQKLGMPLALNAGNWLYFKPFQLIQEMDLDESAKLMLYQAASECLFQAHLGQALDLGSDVMKIPQTEVYCIWKECTSLKTGALMSLSAVCGGIGAGATEEQVQFLKSFGYQLGISLQQLDDVGSLRLENVPDKLLEKFYEDMNQRKPSWIWAVASTFLNTDDYQEFQMQVSKAPASDPKVRSWLLTRGVLAEAKRLAVEGIDASIQTLNGEFPGRKAVQELRQMCEELKLAYEK